MPVTGSVPPLSVFIEILVADDIAGNIAGGYGTLFAEVARAGPAVEFIQTTGPIAVIV